MSATPNVSSAPDGGYGWVIVFASFFIHFMCNGLGLAMGVLCVSWYQEFDTTKTETSWVVSITVAVMLGVGPLVSSLAAKIGYRSMAMVGACFITVGSLLSSMADSVLVLMLTLGVIGGIGSGMCYLPAVAVPAFYFERRRSLAVGLGTAGMGGGMLLLGPVINFLIQYYGWRGTMIILAGFSFNLCVAGALMRPLEPMRPQRRLQNVMVRYPNSETTSDTESLVQSYDEDDPMRELKMKLGRITLDSNSDLASDQSSQDASEMLRPKAHDIEAGSKSTVCSQDASCNVSHTMGSCQVFEETTEVPRDLQRKNDSLKGSPIRMAPFPAIDFPQFDNDKSSRKSSAGSDHSQSENKHKENSIKDTQSLIGSTKAQYKKASGVEDKEPKTQECSFEISRNCQNPVNTEIEKNPDTKDAASDVLVHDESTKQTLNESSNRNNRYISVNQSSFKDNENNTVTNCVDNREDNCDNSRQNALVAVGETFLFEKNPTKGNLRKDESTEVNNQPNVHLRQNNEPVVKNDIFQCNISVDVSQEEQIMESKEKVHIVQNLEQLLSSSNNCAPSPVVSTKLSCGCDTSQSSLPSSHFNVFTSPASHSTPQLISNTVLILHSQPFVASHSKHILQPAHPHNSVPDTSSNAKSQKPIPNPTNVFRSISCDDEHNNNIKNNKHISNINHHIVAQNNKNIGIYINGIESFPNSKGSLSNLKPAARPTQEIHSAKFSANPAMSYLMDKSNSLHSMASLGVKATLAPNILLNDTPMGGSLTVLESEASLPLTAHHDVQACKQFRSLLGLDTEAAHQPQRHGHKSSSSFLNPKDVRATGSIFTLMTLDRSLSQSKRALSRGSHEYFRSRHSLYGSKRDSFRSRNGSFIRSKSTGKRPLSLSGRLQQAILGQFRLLKDTTFLLFVLSNFLTNLSLVMPAVFMVDRAVSVGLSSDFAALLVSLNGAGTIVGRVTIALTADHPRMNRLIAYVGIHLMAGAITCLSPLCGSSMFLHGAYACLFGILTGNYGALCPCVMVDLKGLDSVGESYGMLLMFMGMSNLMSAPMGGILYDLSGSFTPPFLLHGLFLLSAGLMVLPLLQKRNKQRY